MTGGSAQELREADSAAPAPGTIPLSPPADGYTVVELDLGAALAHGRELTMRLRDVIGLPELLVKATASLVERFPLCFARPIDGKRVRRSRTADVGVTMDAGRGRFVPVVVNAGERALCDIARDLTGFRVAALRASFPERDLAGANITITPYDDAVLAVLPGQICALSLAVPEAGREPAHLGLAYDHRFVYGRDAALFLDALRDLLESPETLTSP
jgi:2-oxoglutarate dehydrogenase E2 component (dihydrolipoamide succinyltransferase)